MTGTGAIARRTALLLSAVVGWTATSAALAAAGCFTGTDAERTRCEQERRVDKECAGRVGEALAACRSTVLAPRSERQDCHRLPEGYARNKCEDENLRTDLDARCGGMAGEAFQRCYRDVMTQAAAR